MKLEVFKEVLKDGFNAKELANAIQTSEGHLNELRRSPNAHTIASIVATKFNLNVEEVEKEVVKGLDEPNLEAVFNFAVKREVNLDAIDLKTIAEHKVIRNDRPVVEVGTMTKLGLITMIKKIGNVNMFMCEKDGQVNVYGTAEIMENLITE